MKIKLPKYAAVIALIVALSACTDNRYITEAYIKNNLQQYKQGEYSDLGMRDIYSGKSSEGKAYLTVTGVKRGDEKLVVIHIDGLSLGESGGDASKQACQFVVLSQAEAASMINMYRGLLKRAESDEYVGYAGRFYQDVKFSDQIVLSLHSRMLYHKELDLWICGEKVRIVADKLFSPMYYFLNDRGVEGGGNRGVEGGGK